MTIPANAEALFTGLVQGGLTPVAASGVLGNIEAESGGDLNSVGDGGGGLLGYTPISSAPPGGAPGSPIGQQITAAIAYIQADYPGGISALNAILDPGTAGSDFAHYGERCAACGYQDGSGQLAIRAQNAVDVYTAFQQGTLGSPTQGNAGGTSGTAAATPASTVAARTALGGSGNILQYIDVLLNPSGGGFITQLTTLGASDAIAAVRMLVFRGMFSIAFGAIAFIGLKALTSPGQNNKGPSVSDELNKDEDKTETEVNNTPPVETPPTETVEPAKDFVPPEMPWRVVNVQ